MTTPFWTVRRASWALGIFALLSVLLTLGDPGITMDEPLDVRPGRKYVETLWKRPWQSFFDRKTVDSVYADNAEHPPLGRWLLGLASEGFQWFELIRLGRDPLEPPVYVRAGRVAPAVCFAVLVGLIVTTAGRRYGIAGGVAGGFSLAIMPRVFAHAHFGALDTFVALFWTLALLKVAKAVESDKPIRGMAFAGFFWGLALLTKIHGWLLPPLVFAWILTRLPIRRAIPALMIWTMIGLLVFFAGWPWLWFDPATRLSNYGNTGLHRTTIFVKYFGTIYADKDVPWHYPWVYFAATVPLGLHLIGGLGVYYAIREVRTDRFPLLILGAILGLLVLFSTNVPVYDGERLFLAVFPLWAILIGRGFGTIWDDLIGRKWLRRFLLIATLLQGYSLVSIHPFGLSYYNLAVGGLKGAERLGLELTYWGDAANADLLDSLANSADENSTAALVPTLVPDQGLISTTRTLAQKGIALKDEDAAGRSEWIVIYRREAYWKPEIRDLVKRPAIRLISRDGVWLSGVWRRNRER